MHGIREALIAGGEQTEGVRKLKKAKKGQDMA
jgi:hypothetical protein